MWLTHPPKVIQKIYPSLYWNIPTKENEIFITFDDGPTPGVTDKVLSLLKKYDAKASFFCLGKNVQKEPALFQRILKEGHSVGNHTYNHLNSWKNANEDFMDNVNACAEVFESRLFRPPYGKIRSTQIRKLSKSYKIIMWSALSMDYNKDCSPKQCLNLATKNLKAGDIIVFHDSLKAEKNMFYALEGTLEYAKEKGFKCSSIKPPF